MIEKLQVEHIKHNSNPKSTNILYTTLLPCEILMPEKRKQPETYITV